LTKFYGEVPPCFLQRFYDELAKEWHLWDDKDNMHTVSFGRYHIVPHLTDGWFALAQCFKIQHPTEVHLLYYGCQTFRIVVKGVLMNTSHYPAFHSHSTKPNVTSYFDIFLRDHAATKELLV
jgi:hypothetical protein